MIDDEFDEEIETVLVQLDDDTEEFLEAVAKQALEHMKYMELEQVTNPEALTVDDFGLLKIEQAYLILYALHTKGAIPTNDTITH